MKKLISMMLLAGTSSIIYVKGMPNRIIPQSRTTTLSDGGD